MSNTPDTRESVFDPSVPAIDQTMRILQFLSESSPAPKKLTEVCRKAGIRSIRIGHSFELIELANSMPEDKWKP